MKISSQYDAKCRDCKRQIRKGETVEWKRGVKGVLCLSCADTAPQSASQSARPVTNTAGFPAGYSTDNYQTWTVEWADLKQTLKSAVNDGNFPPLGGTNLQKMREHLTEQYAGFHGFTPGQFARWVNEGYAAEAISGLTEFTPPIREKRRLQFVEDGDEFHVDLAYDGSDKPMSVWTKREVMPGIRVDFQMNFLANVPASVVNEYLVWVCRTMYSLEANGIDCVISVFSKTRNTWGYSDNVLRTTQIIVKKENEVTDFASFSAMLSPGGFRSIVFACRAMQAALAGRNVSHSMGSSVAPGFSVNFNAEAGRIIVESDANASSFPSERMTKDFREALKSAMRGV